MNIFLENILNIYHIIRLFIHICIYIRFSVQCLPVINQNPVVAYSSFGPFGSWYGFQNIRRSSCLLHCETTEITVRKHKTTIIGLLFGKIC